MEERHELYRLHPQQQVAAPGDVGRQRRREVDGPDRERDCGRQRREPFVPPPLAQRGGDAMDPEPPRRSVTGPGKRSRQSLITSQAPTAQEHERGPVLPERADRRGDARQREAEVEVVDPAAEDVHTRPARMAFESDHQNHRSPVIGLVS